MGRFAKFISVAACGAALALVATSAEARPKHRHPRLATGERVLTVHPRNFMDSGTQVPVWSRAAYVQEMTLFNQQPLQKTQPGIIWKPDN